MIVVQDFFTRISFSFYARSSSEQRKTKAIFILLHATFRTTLLWIENYTFVQLEVLHALLRVVVQRRRILTLETFCFCNNAIGKLLGIKSSSNGVFLLQAQITQSKNAQNYYCSSAFKSDKMSEKSVSMASNSRIIVHLLSTGF